MSEQLDIQDFETPAGLVRRSTKRVGALYKASIYPGVFTTRDLTAAVLRTLNEAQAQMQARHEAKEARVAAYARMVAALDVSSIDGPGTKGSFDEIERVYADDPLVITAVQAYKAADARVGEVWALPPPEQPTPCWADEHGPVTLVGVTHAIGIDGATYTLAKGGVWVKDKKGH